MIGEILAIGTAICWATSPIIYRKVLVGSDLVVANLVRAVPATMVLTIFFYASGGFVTVRSLDPMNLLLIIVSVVTGQVLGDLLYFRTRSIEIMRNLFNTSIVCNAFRFSSPE